jgi:hypothetical protein
MAGERSAAEREARNKAMVAEWRRGDSPTSIASRHGLSISWTGQLLRVHGAELPRAGRGIKVDLDGEAVKREYLDNVRTVRAIADDLGVSYGKIYRLLKGRNVAMRRRGRAIPVAQNKAPAAQPGVV